MRPKTSKIWLIDKEELQELLDTSNSFVEVFIKMGIDPYSGNHKTLHARIQEDTLSIEQLIKNRKVARAAHLHQLNRKRKPDKEVFKKGSNYDRKHLKRRILENEWLEYRCEECGITDTYNERPLSLQLDHKNGNNTDNRIENLRFLCPNCHSQTSTFGTKRFKKVKREPKAKRNRMATRKFNPSKKELKKLVQTLPMTQVGRLFNVSDNAVRKRCKLLNIEY